MTNTSHRTLAALAAALTLAACGKGGGEQTAQAAPAGPPADTVLLSARAVAIAGFGTARAERTPWREVWRAPARLTLDPVTTHTLGSIVEGRVSSVLVLPGDRVQAGQVLASIHSHELLSAQSALANAEAGAREAENRLQLAGTEAARAERLYAVKAMSMADLERARAARVSAAATNDQARSELTRAREYLAHLGGATGHEVLVRSPIAGVVVSRSVQPGMVVLPGAPLLVVGRPGSLVLVMQLPEKALAAARVGAPVRFAVASYPDRGFDAEVVRVAPVIDTLSRTVDVTARVRDPDGALRAEMFAQAELLGPPGDSALIIPAGAVQDFDGDTAVIAAERRGEGVKLSAVRVRIGRRDAQRAEVVAGLSPGTNIVVQGAAVAKAEILRRRGAGE